jgi:hypothetical protein
MLFISKTNLGSIGVILHEGAHATGADGVNQIPLTLDVTVGDVVKIIPLKDTDHARPLYSTEIKADCVAKAAGAPVSELNYLPMYQSQYASQAKIGEVKQGKDPCAE